MKETKRTNETNDVSIFLREDGQCEMYINGEFECGRSDIDMMGYAIDSMYDMGCLNASHHIKYYDKRTGEIIPDLTNDNEFSHMMMRKLKFYCQNRIWDEDWEVTYDLYEIEIYGGFSVQSETFELAWCLAELLGTDYELKKHPHGGYLIKLYFA